MEEELARPEDSFHDRVWGCGAGREAEAVTEEELARGLAALGYRVEDEEMRQLAEQVGPGGPGTGGVRKSAFVASQLDWPALQSDFRCVPPARVVPPVHTCVTCETLTRSRLRHTPNPVHNAGMFVGQPCRFGGLARKYLRLSETLLMRCSALKLPRSAGKLMAGWAAAGANGWRRRGVSLRAWRAARRAAWRRASWSRVWLPSCRPPRSSGPWRMRCWRPGSGVRLLLFADNQWIDHKHHEVSFLLCSFDHKHHEVSFLLCSFDHKHYEVSFLLCSW